ncbi:hypothetical protein [Mucilaginibacter sp.]|uniref:hypothetical protein n=1 Tax=Mucilaginibacter sp. TaxID=1882438 RepID=UPI003D11CF5B
MYYNLFTSKLLKKYTIAAILIIVIFELINIIFFQSIKQFPSNTLDVVYCIYITYTLLYLKQMMLKPTEEKLYAQSAFLFTVSLVFFTCCMFIFYTLENYFYKNHISFAPLLIVNYAANYIFYLTAGIAILIDKKVYKSNFI